MSESIQGVVIKKSLPKIIVKVVVWLLSLFAVGGIIDYLVNRDLKAENKRLGVVNARQADSLLQLVDTVTFQSTVLGVVLFENDSLKQRTGDIQIDTVRVDSVRVDTVAFVTIDSVLVPIPLVVAEELESCRALAPECAKLKQQVDTLLVYIPTVIDSLTRQIEVQAQIINPTWDLGIFKLPKPKDMCGIMAGYNLIGRSVTYTTYTQQDEFYTPETSTENVSRWNITLGCGIGIRMGIL